VLDRALTESGAEPPPVSLTAETLIATLKIPAKWVTKKITDGEARRQVQAMYDELMATGRVETTLPEDDRVVRDLHQREVVAPREAKLAEERARRLASPPSAPTSDRTARPEKPAALAGRRHDFKTKAAEPASSQTPVVVPAAPSRSGLASLSKAEPRCYLLESDDLERAPSIGPKLAERLAAGGLAKVADFLAADPSATIALLGDSRFDEDMIERWKKEARLVLRVPGLRGTHAQLLVGAGFETAESLAMADPMTVSSALLAYATTPGGARILRNGDAPDVEAVTRWVQCAQHALAA